MCGITGLFNFSGSAASDDVIKSMTDAIKHRGPDGEGFFREGNMALGHRRLSIIDLSEKGSQPMKDENASVIIAYNGEVYNFKDIRKELKEKGYDFRSETDTEVVLYAYKEWGISCIRRFNGMFAFALWDRKNKKGYLARDRYGIKPLYYYKDGEKLVFGSEIKAILKHPEIKADLDYKALKEYFTFQNVLSDRTLFKGIRLMEPGSYIEFGPETFNKERYWDYDFISGELKLQKKEIISKLREIFERAVRRQMVSDVPVSSYLSSGMDSCSIATVASGNTENMRTFTAGFDMRGVSGFENDFDEREKARIMAEHLSTEHHETEVSSEFMEKSMETLVYHIEDLRMGMSFPNYAVAGLVSGHNKVVLAGTGGDELFCGYPWRYNHAVGNKDRGEYIRNYYGLWQRLAGDDEKQEMFTQEALRMMEDYDTFEVFRKVFDKKNIDPNNNRDCVNNALQFEARTFLHGLLVIEDKISMAHSLETRVPFLDNEMVDLAMKTPLSLKLKNYEKLMRAGPDEAEALRGSYVESTDGKLILREAMEGLIPEEIAFNKKQGFSAPVAEWFRKHSRSYVEDVLLSEKALNRGIFNPEYVRKRLQAHFEGKENNRLLIWSLLCFEHWCRRWLD